MNRKGKWVAIPAVRSNATNVNLRFYIILLVLLFSAISGPIAIVLSMTHKTPPAVVSNSDFSSSRAIAYIAANDYLNGRPISAPLAAGLNPNMSTDGTANNQLPYKSFTYIGQESKIEHGNPYELNYFLVTANSNLFILTVVTRTENGITAIASIPSITVYNTKSEAVSPVSYTGDPLEKTNGLPEPVATVINSWAAAYVNGDSQEIKIVTNQQGDFPVLTGFKLDGDPQIGTVLQSGNNYLVRVTLKLNYENSKFFSSSAYDILIDSVGSQQPHVVSWAPAGFAPTKPYINKVGN